MNLRQERMEVSNDYGVGADDELNNRAKGLRLRLHRNRIRLHERIPPDPVDVDDYNLLQLTVNKAAYDRIKSGDETVICRTIGLAWEFDIWSKRSRLTHIRVRQFSSVNEIFCGIEKIDKGPGKIIIAKRLVDVDECYRVHLGQIFPTSG